MKYVIDGKVMKLGRVIQCADGITTITLPLPSAFPEKMQICITTLDGVTTTVRPYVESDERSLAEQFEWKGPVLP